MLLHAFDASCVAVEAGAGEGFEVLQGQIGEEGLVGSDWHAAFDFAVKVQVDLVGKGYRKNGRPRSTVTYFNEKETA